MNDMIIATTLPPRRELMKPPEGYGEIEEYPDGYLLWKNTDTIMPITLSLLGVDVTIARGRQSDDARFYIQNIFYPKSKYTREVVERIRDETFNCPKCRLGFNTNLIRDGIPHSFKNNFHKYIDKESKNNTVKKNMGILDRIDTFMSKAGGVGWKHIALGSLVGGVLDGMFVGNNSSRFWTATALTAAPLIPWFNRKLGNANPYLLATAMNMWAGVVSSGMRAGAYGIGVPVIDNMVSTIRSAIGFGAMEDLFGKIKARLGMGVAPSSFNRAAGYEKLDPLAKLPGLQGIMRQTAVKIKR